MQQTDSSVAVSPLRFDTSLLFRPSSSYLHPFFLSFPFLPISVLAFYLFSASSYLSHSFTRLRTNDWSRPFGSARRQASSAAFVACLLAPPPLFSLRTIDINERHSTAPFDSHPRELSVELSCSGFGSSTIALPFALPLSVAVPLSVALPAFAPCRHVGRYVFSARHRVACANCRHSGRRAT